MTYKVLLVEDDQQIREIAHDILPVLSNGEIEIFEAEDGNRALEIFFEENIDLILLDIMLPGMNGFDICRELRKESAVPIIFLTAKSREVDILKGYSYGCDDYIVKPFSFEQLYVKIKAILKRSKGMVLGRKMTCGDISLDPINSEVTAKNKMISLAPKEFAILKLLMENKNHIVSRDTIIIKIWGYDSDCSPRVVDNHIKKLRKSLGNYGKQIKTIVTKGYRLEETGENI